MGRRRFLSLGGCSRQAGRKWRPVPLHDWRAKEEQQQLQRISRCEEPTTFTGGPFHAGTTLHNLKKMDPVIFSLGETWRTGVIPDYSRRIERLLLDQPSKEVLPQIFQSADEKLQPQPRITY
ncbi:uncharacterized protein LOC132710078 isoform X4 [Pantherophis guttatus]|uniref:Uncharacterized protein LOC132710078 isoform X4 n=1 Tax=Pantherophis guttatus TaxID=94885 RepID=A0ABM3YZF4_PANGU|nr:uncharacterized protein LOC132710078 isoform X4 [Pantherophis guttatus]